jgi:hypothetical protein
MTWESILAAWSRVFGKNESEKTPVYPIKTCVLCAGRNLTSAFLRYENGGELYKVKCPDCGFNDRINFRILTHPA